MIRIPTKNKKKRKSTARGGGGQGMGGAKAKSEQTAWRGGCPSLLRTPSGLVGKLHIC